MAQKKDDPGADPAEGAAAKDGQPDHDELERRRNAKSGTSVAERAANGESDEPEEELFPLGSLDGDSKVTLKTLIKSNADVFKKASMGTAAVPIKGSGFFDPEEEVTLLVRALPGGIVPVPTHEKTDGSRHKVKSWNLTQQLTPIHVQDAGSMYTREQVVELLDEAGVASAVVSRLLGEEPRAAQG